MMACGSLDLYVFGVDADIHRSTAGRRSKLEMRSTLCSETMSKSLYQAHAFRHIGQALILYY